MTSVVYKYQIQRQSILNLPRYAEIISCGVQHDQVYIWAKVDLSQSAEARYFLCAMTGEDLPPHGKLLPIGTVHLFGGTIVMHVFEHTSETM